ncbi:MAG TPA: peptidoglycan glycosyltransferase [Eubacterium sp.]|nr:peptidoglycan glycosyltransferase [Eubacterium sp.]
MKRKLMVGVTLAAVVIVLLLVRLAVIMLVESEYYGQRARELHERERPIKAARGRIISGDGTVLASNKTVCTISVVHAQITEPDKVIDVLSSELGMDREKVAKSVHKVSSMERIKTNVTKEIGDAIREYGLDGVKIDEDSRRYYPFGSLASKVIGFTGSDNQGIIGLEVRYDEELAGEAGQILTMTDAGGIELKKEGEERVEPVNGDDLIVSLDYNIQTYAQQAAYKAYEAKKAKRVSIIVMNPQDGRIYAMVNVPEYNLNAPYTLIDEYSSLTVTQKDENGDDVTKTIPKEELTNEQKMNLLNNMWRNFCINDTYEPGSTFKIVTATAALEKGVVSLSDSFYCRGSLTVGGRTIRCHKTSGHGSQTFAQTLMNSCNPAFITWGSRVGAEDFFAYMKKLGLLEKTGVDLPGEAGTIIHKLKNVGEVELATMSFGQSFQITPLQLLRAASAIINGGTLITPHFAVKTVNEDGETTKVFEYERVENAVSGETSGLMKQLLESVVSEGGGKRCYIDGYRIGGKTATSQKLPRGSGKYIASFIGFAPADNPQVIAMCIIDEPEGIYYGGTIAAPVIREVFENILPYLGIEQEVVEFSNE